MGFKFRKNRRSIKILPGIRLNTGKKGINSVSIGGKNKNLFGAITNINLKTGKTKTTRSIKGVGSFEHRSDVLKQNSNRKTPPKTVLKRNASPPARSRKLQAVALPSSTRWYERSWFAILAILLFPPLGIVAIWSSKWSKTWKISSTIIAVIWSLFLYVGGTPEDPPEPVLTSPEVEAGAEVSVEESPSKETPPSQKTSWEEVFQEAERLSDSAQTLADIALSPDDWSLIAGRLERSVHLYESIPESDTNYSEAQAKLEPLKRQLTYAQKGQAVPDDTFPHALEVATKAANLTQTAQLRAEWEEVAANWQEAIELLRLVPEDSPNLEAANAKVLEYENNLQYAQAQAVKAVPSPLANNQPEIIPARESRTGSCDCPYDYTSSGSRCGDRSAYSKPGGRSPVCYVTAE